MKILSKLVDLISFLCKTNLERDNLISEPYIYKDKILATIDILPFREEKVKMLIIKKEQILKFTFPRGIYIKHNII